MASPAADYGKRSKTESSYPASIVWTVTKMPMFNENFSAPTAHEMAYAACYIRDIADAKILAVVFSPSSAFIVITWIFLLPIILILSAGYYDSIRKIATSLVNSYLQWIRTAGNDRST